MSDGTPLVLLVEDNEGHAALMQSALSRPPGRFRVTLARSLSAAREQAQEATPDVVVADLVLPDGRGTELIADAPPPGRLPVVIMTARGDESAAVEVMKAGALDYVTKSDEAFRDMPHVVERALRQWRLLSEKETAESVVREHEARLSSIFRAAPVGIGLVVERVLVEVNQQICEMLGREPGELIDQSARVLYPTQEDYERVGRVKYAQIAESGTGTVETRWQCKDGRVLDVLLSSTSLDPEDLGKGVTFTALDITALKRTQSELRQLNADLETRVEERTRELNQLVQAMAGREVRMAELKRVIKELRRQLQDAGLEPVTDDPLAKYGASGPVEE